MATFDFRKWWSEHKDERNRARRRRYGRDEAYRRGCVMRSRWYRTQRRSGEESAGAWTRKAARPTETERRLKARVDGDGQPLLSLNEVASRARLMPQTLVRWETLGLIAPMRRDDAGHRFMPQAYADALVELVERGRREMWSTPRLSRELTARTKKETKHESGTGSPKR